MLKRGDYLMIEHKHDDGVYIKDIGEELGVHPRTVSRALKRGGAPAWIADILRRLAAQDSTE